MKTLFYVLILLGAMGCDMVKTSTKPSGKVITQTKDLASFVEIENTSTYDIKVIKGDKQNATIETDDNAIQFVEMVVEANRLIITVKNEAIFSNLTKANITITVDSINYIKNVGTGDVVIAQLDSLQQFKFENEGTGDTDIQLNCQTLNIQNTGTGDLKLKTNVQSLKLRNSSTGDVNIRESNIKDFYVNNQGTGDLLFEGKTIALKIINSGTGDVEADKMLIDSLDLINNGTGDVKINAQKMLSISSNGIGDITYKGNPTLQKIEINGIGSVNRVE